jgi:hypothetical protein
MVWARKSSRALTKGWIATLASVGLGAGMFLEGEVHLDPYKSGIKWPETMVAPRPPV